MRLLILMTMALTLGGCTTLSEGDLPEVPWSRSAEARRLMDTGELYRARRIAVQLLDKNPADHEAQGIMAEVINLEITRHKEVLEPKAVEEFTGPEKQGEIRTWLERSRSLMELGRYEEATQAAEKVFLYDPLHAEASKLIDQIRDRALQEGKAVFSYEDRIREEEIRQRIQFYLDDAEKGISRKQWSAAGLAVEKVLYLDPSNTAALSLEKQIKAHGKSAIT